ncbi:SAM-dependent methyltransferase [Streptomyces hyaluromycini]|uniref:SAM-dependent methyltransferase n=1 Tax=Streptomyces hyaluromycini TaxID=1377993 RepID=A0ABV1WRK8_9ACTN
MNQQQTPLSHTIDVTRPSVARMHDYFLGGKDNYPADRRACERLLAHAPSAQILAVNNRRFLHRVIRCLIQDHGIRQFLDIGSGLPTKDNVHEIAQHYAPGAKVAYVDHDPMVLAYGRALLEDYRRTDRRIVTVQADLRDPDALLDHPAVTGILDLHRPVAVLYLSVLHCVADRDRPADIVRRTAARLSPGSFVAVSHLVSEDAAVRRTLTDLMAQSTGGQWGAVRRAEDVDRFFTALDILDPGLVDVAAWRADPLMGPRQRTWEWIQYGGVARVP